MKTILFFISIVCWSINNCKTYLIVIVTINKYYYYIQLWLHNLWVVCITNPCKCPVVDDFHCSEQRTLGNHCSVIVGFHSLRHSLQHVCGNDGIVHVTTHSATTHPGEQRHCECIAHRVYVHIWKTNIKYSSEQYINQLMFNYDL